MRVGSLFSGIGGFELGLERAGMTTAWQCEINPFARHILAKHWPDVPCYDDVTALRGREVEPVDLICGGFPCQDISNAGKRAGIEGERSSLWGEIARLVGELRPRYVVVENVAALRRRGLDRVLGDLASLGYDAEWDSLRASDFGAPHRRDRIWIVAYPTADVGGRDARESDAQGVRERDVAYPKAVGKPRRCEVDKEGRSREGRPLVGTGPGTDGGDQPGDRSEGSGRHRGDRVTSGARALADPRSTGPQGHGTTVPTWDGRGGGAVADAHPLRRSGWARVFGPEGWQESADRRTELARAWATEPDVGRVAHGVPARVDRLTGVGNALVPQIAEWIGRRILAYEAVLGSSLDAAQRR